MNCQAHLHRSVDATTVSRRWFLRDCGVGLGAIALADLLGGSAHGATSAAAGLRSLVFVAVDRGYLSEQEQTELVGRAASMARMIGSLIFRL